ncbi:MAG TPA: tol-pal system protein YbgF [Thermodesulfovibrionales bacterium]|nr:tol-pal system protein YbgF [Thermodesulfovibrionales bacterium]
MTSRSAVVLLFFSLLILSGCVSTTDFDASRRDIIQLKKDTSELKKDMTDIKKQVTGAAKEETFNAVRESQTSLYSQVSDLSKDVRVLSGRFDENKFFIEKTLRDAATERELLRSQINSLETRVKELSERLPKPSETTSHSVAAEAQASKKEEREQKKENAVKAPKTVPEEIDDDPVKAYETAYSLFEEKEYREARDRFAAFLKKFPKDSRAENAQFWIAESYFAEKNYEDAILAYESMIKSYPQSKKMAGALYKQGLSFSELSDNKTAKVIFQKLIEKYPDTKQADMAKKKIAEMDKKPAKTKSKRS